MVTVKKLAECTFAQAVDAWNKGFEGYYFDATTTVDRFVARFAQEGLSADLSVVAFDGDCPVGLVLSGTRRIHGKTVAWNGGTGVALPYRRKGVGRMLMTAVLALYREAGVEIATLEAFSQNQNAIALYQSLGYEVIDQLLFLQHTEAFSDDPFALPGKWPYTLVHGIPHDVRRLPFYHHMSPWQTHWSSVRDGEALMVRDGDGETIGYVLYKRMFDDAGDLVSITLMQGAAADGREDGEDILRFALSHAFRPWKTACRRSTFNLPASERMLVDLLTNAGFFPSIEQVFMRKQMADV